MHKCPPPPSRTKPFSREVAATYTPFKAVLVMLLSTPLNSWRAPNLFAFGAKAKGSGPEKPPAFPRNRSSLLPVKCDSCKAHVHFTQQQAGLLVPAEHPETRRPQGRPGGGRRGGSAPPGSRGRQLRRRERPRPPGWRPLGAAGCAPGRPLAGCPSPGLCVPFLEMNLNRSNVAPAKESEIESDRLEPRRQLARPHPRPEPRPLGQDSWWESTVWTRSDLEEQSDVGVQSDLERESDVGVRRHPGTRSDVGVQRHLGTRSDVGVHRYVGARSDVGVHRYLGAQSDVGLQRHLGSRSDVRLQSNLRSERDQRALPRIVAAPMVAQAPRSQSGSIRGRPSKVNRVSAPAVPRPVAWRRALPESSSRLESEESLRPHLLSPNLEARLSRFFRDLGWTVGEHPWVFLMMPLLLTIALGSGLVLLSQVTEKDLQELYLPLNTRARAEQQFVQMHFPNEDVCRFSAYRQSKEIHFASILVVAKTDTVLDGATMSEIRQLDDLVQALSVTLENGTHVSYQTVCAKDMGFCEASNPLLFAWRVNSNMDLKSLTYPIHNQSGQPIDLAGYFGGTTLGKRIGMNKLLLKAKAMRLIYFLITDDREYSEHSKKWLVKFLDQFGDIVKSLALKNIQVVYFTSLSSQLEFEAAAKAVIPLFYLVFILMLLFVIISSYRVNCILNKMWVGAFGVISVALAVVTSFGLLLYTGVPVMLTVANSPFLILGVGVDDILSMISAWQETSFVYNTGQRMADVYSKVAVPITISTITNALTLYTGIMLPFKGIQSFCMYTGTSLIFCYFYNITCFGAVMALDGKREKVCVRWLKKSGRNPNQKCASLKRLWCPLDIVDKQTNTHPMNLFFRDYFGPFLVNPWCKISVVILYILYMVCSIYGCFQLQTGLNLKFLASDVSYVTLYFNVDKEYFSHYGPRVMIIITEAIAYWDEATRKKLKSCLKVFEKSDHVDEILTEFWLYRYIAYMEANQLDANTKNNFIKNLRDFFKDAPYFQDDINITSSQEIISSRAFIQTMNMYSSMDKKHLLTQFRSIAQRCEIPLMVYNQLFVHYEQYTVIAGSTIRYIIIASAIMLLLSLFLISHPVCTFWVAFAIVSMVIGVMGFMAFWRVSLDSVSIISLVICVGFSYGFSINVACVYISSSKPLANQKSIETLYLLGYPMLQSVVSLILGLCLLTLVKACIFKVFLKSMLLVVVLGAAHGLVFIPVFLTFF
ncbi:patched domain-containing protein 3-like [Erinaceus europaeus]|uniref:Patched domain-containing protein 3-like n=1 Tax=Erinaceus europaeus TaxID=9365 RepID=A0ABM3XIJ8_ERIEU|nr:patched domain-containing protein 3-like [Erinaceus europaeus]